MSKQNYRYIKCIYLKHAGSKDCTWVGDLFYFVLTEPFRAKFLYKSAPINLFVE